MLEEEAYVKVHMSVVAERSRMHTASLWWINVVVDAQSVISLRLK